VTRPEEILQTPVPSRPIAPEVVGTEPNYYEHFPEPGTPEWGAMVQTRRNLIQKKIRGDLSESELKLYHFLKQKTQDIVEAKYPFNPVV
jgi:hypothetical protein